MFSASFSPDFICLAVAASFAFLAAASSAAFTGSFDDPPFVVVDVVRWACITASVIGCVGRAIVKGSNIARMRYRNFMVRDGECISGSG